MATLKPDLVLAQPLQQGFLNETPFQVQMDLKMHLPLAKKLLINLHSEVNLQHLDKLLTRSAEIQSPVKEEVFLEANKKDSDKARTRAKI